MDNQAHRAESQNADGKIVALCTGATGISSIHLMRHMHKDPRFGKIYGVSRRDLYDVPVGDIEHIRLDLLEPQKVKEELKSRRVNDGAQREQLRCTT